MSRFSDLSLSACAIALALLGAPSQASAAIVDVTSIAITATPSSIFVGGSSTIEISIYWTAEDPLAVIEPEGFVLSGDGQEQLVFAGCPGVGFQPCVFSYSFTYLTPGDFQPSYEPEIFWHTFAQRGTLLLDTVYGDYVHVSPSVSPVPLPAALPLFAGGLGGLGVMGWWRWRKAAAEFRITQRVAM